MIALGKKHSIEVEFDVMSFSRGRSFSIRLRVVTIIVVVIVKN
jgi:hypothetical protein